MHYKSDKRTFKRHIPIYVFYYADGYFIKMKIISAKCFSNETDKHTSRSTCIMKGSVPIKTDVFRKPNVKSIIPELETVGHKPNYSHK